MTIASHEPIDVFDYEQVPVGDVTLHVATSGTSGPPVMLLHGFPQTHLAWRHVAADLRRDHRVLCPDLRGYGASDKPPPDAAASGYSKRTMAADVIGLARALGHDRVALVGHDRGALVAFRAALDHPEAVSHLATIGVLPTVDMWRSLHGQGGIFAFHLFLLAHPSDLPQRLIGAAPEVFFGHFLDVWSSTPMPPQVRAAYLAAASTPEAIAAVCADYRSEAFIDAALDEADQAAGRTLSMPVTALWEDPGDAPLPFDPVAVWRSWAPDLATAVLPGGHLLPEACPDQVVDAVRELLQRS